jgi:hypothetical protein
MILLQMEIVLSVVIIITCRDSLWRILKAHRFFYHVRTLSENAGGIFISKGTTRVGFKD